jgi:hypothetical protein
MVPGVRRGHNRENHFYMCLYWKKIFRFQSNLEQIILMWRESKIAQIKGQVLFKGELITKCKSGMRSLKNLLLENHQTRIAQIYTKASWHSADTSLCKWSLGAGRGHSRGNYFYMCILEESFEMKHLVNFNKLGANHSCMKEVQVYSNEGASPQ